jgi:DNA-binding transcriptional LysR family regulator
MPTSQCRLWRSTPNRKAQIPRLPARVAHAPPAFAPGTGPNAAGGLLLRGTANDARGASDLSQFKGCTSQRLTCHNPRGSYGAAMELRHLRYFKAVAELLNFSRAAEQMHVAQPALSRQIRALEEELGARLLDRDRGVRLTDAGRTFYAQTCKILAQVDIAIAAVREPPDRTSGELIVCNDWRLSGQFLPTAVTEFHRQFPRAEVTLRDLRYHDQLIALRAHKAHVGFVVRSVLSRRDDLETLLVLTSQIAVVLPAHHALAGESAAKLADLADDAWVTLDEKEAPGYRAFITQICRLSGFTPRFGRSATTVDGLFGRVAAGYGIAITVANSAPRNNPLLRVLASDIEPLELCAVWHRKETSPLLHAFIDILRQQAEEKDPNVAPETLPKISPTRPRKTLARRAKTTAR